MILAYAGGLGDRVKTQVFGKAVFYYFDSLLQTADHHVGPIQKTDLMKNKGGCNYEAAE